MATARPSPQGVLTALAVLLEYPSGSDWSSRMRRGAAQVGEEAPEVSAALSPFLREATRVEARGLEETYTQTFDWSRERSLDLGWHLHGETYDRGAFMVRMRELLRRAGVAEDGQLPDHLGRVLVALDRVPGPEGADLIETKILPAVSRIEAGFDARGGPYASVVRAVRLALEARAAAAGGGVSEEAGPCSGAEG